MVVIVRRVVGLMTGCFWFLWEFMWFLYFAECPPKMLDDFTWRLKVASNYSNSKIVGWQFGILLCWQWILFCLRCVGARNAGNRSRWNWHSSTVCGFANQLSGKAVRKPRSSFNGFGGTRTHAILNSTSLAWKKHLASALIPTSASASRPWEHQKGKFWPGPDCCHIVSRNGCSCIWIQHDWNGGYCIMDAIYPPTARKSQMVCHTTSWTVRVFKEEIERKTGWIIQWLAVFVSFLLLFKTASCTLLVFHYTKKKVSM